MSWIIDTHCDVLMKLERNPQWSFSENDKLDIDLKKLRTANVKVQAFAIFIDPATDSRLQFDVALRQIDAFKRRVLIYSEIKQLRSFDEITDLQEDEVGVFLTLEGLDCIGNSISLLNTLLDEGVLSVGMTWNSVNHACDGAGEPRGGGLTNFGKEVVELLNERNVLIDTAHISVAGFWDVIQSGKRVWNSHCGVNELLDHPRNLDKEQIEAIVRKGGTVHMVYLPDFIASHRPVQIDDLLSHIRKMIEWGFEDHIGLGSDFDGISAKIIGLEDAGKTQNLVQAIRDYFGDKITDKICYQNYLNFVRLK